MNKTARLPRWFKVRLRPGENYRMIRSLLAENRLHTVCQEARCPNIWECWNSGTATFMILGDQCSRNCAFCGVEPFSEPPAPDSGEPGRIADAVSRLGLAWAVLTSVTRDDLPDHGSGQFAACVEAVRELAPDCGTELLIPDMQADRAALDRVAGCGAGVLAHNIETVPSLYARLRPRADYRRSLEVLRLLAQRPGRSYTVKSSMIVGLGETTAEIASCFGDLVSSGCEAATIGQYLPPSRRHPPVERYYTPEEFGRLADTAREAGISHVAAGPLVRSSYHAHDLAGRSLHRGP